MKRFLALALSCVVAPSCSASGSPDDPCLDCAPGSGAVRLSMPLASDAARVAVTVTGAGIPAPITSELAITGSPPVASGTVAGIPAGDDRVVAVDAFAATAPAPEADLVVYRGDTTVAVHAGQTAHAALVLLPVAADVAITAELPAGDVDLQRVDHVSAVVSGNRIAAPPTFYLAVDPAAPRATGTALRVPVGALRTVLVQSFSATGALLHSGAADIAVPESGAAATVVLANVTETGSVAVDASFCGPSCGPSVCGDDGCGGSCGGCPPSASCNGGACVIAFDLVAARSTSASSVEIGFSSPPDAHAAEAGAYCVALGAPASCVDPGDLAVLAATPAGSSVTLHTAAQAPGEAYSVFVTGVTRAGDGAPLGRVVRSFTGFPAFTVAAAAALSRNEVEVRYSAPVDPAGAATQAATYLVGAAGGDGCATEPVTVGSATASAPTTVRLAVSGVAGNGVHRVCVVGPVRRLVDGVALAGATATFAGYNLVSNGSFEAAAGAPPDWTMMTTGTFSASAGLVPAANGSSVAAFSSLTTGTGREAASSCFPVQPGTLSLTASVRTPQPVARTKASFKMWWFIDATCSTPAAHPSDTQSSSSLDAPDTWESRAFAQPVPEGAAWARVSVRASYVSGVGASTDVVYFDDLVAFE